jgi:class 3 adenylate cyclase/tetratricopeptide (TPR) repeat protein
VPVCTSCGVESPDGFRYCGACGAPLAGGAQRELRKTVTVLFSDVTGSTALGERLDPEALRRILATYFKEIRAIIQRHGGSVEKFIGDAVMAVFGVPQVHEDDALRAVRAAAELRDCLPALADQAGTALQFRTGVNTGEVVVGTLDVLATGDAVNVAARLEQAAAPGEILIGAPTYALVRDAVDVEAVAPLAAKGKAEPLEAYLLTRVDEAAPGRARRLDLPLVGRAHELTLLREAYDLTLRVSGCQLFTLLGAAGVGKSRLARGFLSEIDGQATVTTGRCLPYGEGITFSPLVEILGQLGDLAKPVLRRVVEGGSASKDELFGDLRSALEQAATERPLVAVLDDVQWAEPLLVELVEHVVRLSRSAPILLLCVARSELLEEHPAWGDASPNATTMALQPLGPTECRELAQRLDAGIDQHLVERVVRASEGNPLFLQEMVALAREDGSTDVPPSIHAVVTARIERLGIAERVALECGAVEGEIFHKSVVTALAGGSIVVDEHLASLLQKELIYSETPQIPHDQAYRFSHLLIRDAAYQTLPKSRRAELHEQFANWIEHHGRDVVELDQIAGWHLEQAIEYRTQIGLTPLPHLARRASQHLVDAARAAGGRTDLRACEQLLRRALALMEANDPHHAHVAVELAEALTARGLFAEAAELLGEPSTIAAAPAYTTLALCSLLAQSDVAVAGEAIRHDLPAARDALQRVGDDRGLARVALLESAVQHWECRAESSFMAARRAADHARRARDRALLVRATRIQVTEVSAGPQPRAEVEQVLDEVEQSDEAPSIAANLLWERATLAQYDGRFDEARRLLVTARSVLDESGDEIRFAAIGERMAAVELAAEEPQAAVRILRASRRALLRFAEYSSRPTHAADLADALYHAGQPAEAESMAREAGAQSAPDDIVNFIIIRSVLARLHADRGDFETALQLADEAVHTAYRTDHPREHARAELGRAHVLAAGGHQEQAREAAIRALACYELKGDHTSAARVTKWLASLAEASPSQSPA